MTDLTEYFVKDKKYALSFSGGTDSSYLLYAALKAKADIIAYYVKSEFQPEFEYNDATKLCRELGAKLRVINVSVLENQSISDNPQNRCYFCKRVIFGEVIQAAKADGCDVIIDGTNASDDDKDRPGMKALFELGIQSPLKLCGIRKSEVRVLSKAAGLFTADKCSYACLATRIPTGVTITSEALRNIEGAEDALFKMGFRDFRVRTFASAAGVQMSKAQFDKAVLLREDIKKALYPFFDTVLLDLKTR